MRKAFVPVFGLIAGRARMKLILQADNIYRLLLDAIAAHPLAPVAQTG